MKTFESEFGELADWIRQKNKEQFEAEKKDTTRGRDSSLMYERRKVVNEYNRRLTELKKKYGIEETELSAPGTKARTVNQEIQPMA